MDNALKEGLVYAMLRFRKIGIKYSFGLGLRLNELCIMREIAESPPGPDKNVGVSDIQNNLFVTKPAVSQTLNALENKGYIGREIDKNDRRKVNVAITPEGLKVLKESGASANRMLEAVISRFGEENTVKLTELFNLLADILDDLNPDAAKTDIKGEK